jgi:LuxR family maltose regulon positive regulatory protein
VAAFTGSHRHIVDYLGEEVLQRQPAAVQEFLQQTSILDRFTGPLCEAVTGQTDSQRLIRGLERDNLFLVPLDDERHWYRYHHLFAQVLRQRLQQAPGTNTLDLHHRAAAWLEQDCLTHEAVHHWLAAGDFEQAARLIEQIHGAKWQSGEIKTLQDWLAALPAAAWHAHPRLWLVEAWAAMTVGDFEAADTALSEAEQAVARLDATKARLSRPEVAAFRACHAGLVQDPMAVELARQALRDLPSDYWMRGMLVVFLSGAYYLSGDLEAASEVLAQAPAQPPHHIHLLAFGSQLELAKGRLNRAVRLFQRALALAEPGGQPLPFVGTLVTYMTAGMVLYERNDLEQAEAYLKRCLALAASLGSQEVQLCNLSYLMLVSLVRHDLDRAVAYGAQIDDLLLKQRFVPSTMAMVNYHRLLLLLRQGNPAAAGAWAEAYSDESGPLNAYAFHRLALPQILMVSGSPALAAEKLALLVQEARNTGHGNLLIKGLVLQALAVEARGQRAQSELILERALALAEPEGFVRSFVDEGAPMRAMLARVTGERQPYARRLLAAFELTPASPPGRPAAPIPAAQLLEPLHDRELEVLHLIAQGFSNGEIAERLVLGKATIKTHINRLFHKLDVTSRTQALVRARALGLLAD